MRYLMIWHPAEETLNQAPSPELYERMGKLIQDSMASGILLSTGGISGGSKGFRVRRANNKVTVLDGPYTEAKEVIGGYALCELPSREAAIEFTKQFLEIAGTGETEIHQLDSQ